MRRGYIICLAYEIQASKYWSSLILTFKTYGNRFSLPKNFVDSSERCYFPKPPHTPSKYPAWLDCKATKAAVHRRRIAVAAFKKLKKKPLLAITCANDNSGEKMECYNKQCKLVNDSYKVAQQELKNRASDNKKLRDEICRLKWVSKLQFWVSFTRLKK